MKKWALGLGSLAGGLALAAGAMWWRHSFPSQMGRPVETQAVVARPQRSPVVTEEKRKVFPYSLVPGGAKSVEEARKSMLDPALKSHYAAFDLSKLKQVTLTADLTGYLSYRVGDNIYWTSKPLTIRAGETVFTDGDHVARGRCLNCYSAHPMMPVRPNEPSEKTFDMWVEAPYMALAFPNLLPGTPRLPPPPVEAAQAAPARSPAKGHKFFPLLPLIPLVPVIAIHGYPTTPVVPPYISVVPEPDYRWLTLGALAALAIAGRVRSRRAKRPENQSIR